MASNTSLTFRLLGSQVKNFKAALVTLRDLKSANLTLEASPELVIQHHYQ